LAPDPDVAGSTIINWPGSDRLVFDARPGAGGVYFKTDQPRLTRFRGVAATLHDPDWRAYWAVLKQAV